MTDDEAKDMIADFVFANSGMPNPVFVYHNAKAIAELLLAAGFARGVEAAAQVVHVRGGHFGPALADDVRSHLLPRAETAGVCTVVLCEESDAAVCPTCNRARKPAGPGEGA